MRGATLVNDNFSGSGDWTDSDRWSLSLVPNQTHSANLGNLVGVNAALSSDAGSIGRVSVGTAGAAGITNYFTLNSGAILTSGKHTDNVLDYTAVGYLWQSSATVNEGATWTAEQNFVIGRTSRNLAANAVTTEMLPSFLNLLGGDLLIKGALITGNDTRKDGGAAITLNNGGTLSFASWTYYTQPNFQSFIDILDGTVYANGNVVNTALNTWIANNRIKTTEPGKFLSVSYDSGLNKTVITAIPVPEPSTLALVALAGLGFAFRRRGRTV